MKYILGISSSFNLSSPCSTYFRAEQTRTSFPISTSFYNDLFDLIHCDFCGPYKHPTCCGSFYFLTIVDDFSRTVSFYLLSNKSAVPKFFEQFYAFTHNQFGKTIEVVHSNIGIDFYV